SSALGAFVAGAVIVSVMRCISPGHFGGRMHPEPRTRNLFALNHQWHRMLASSSARWQQELSSASSAADSALPTRETFTVYGTFAAARHVRGADRRPQLHQGLVVGPGRAPGAGQELARNVPDDAAARRRPGIDVGREGAA